LFFKRLSQGQAISRVLKGGDVATTTIAEARSLANKVSQRAGGGGFCAVDAPHGPKAVTHAHALVNAEERVEEAGHIFVQAALSGFLLELGDIFSDPDGDGIPNTEADLWEWVSPVPLPLAVPSGFSNKTADPNQTI
jgi:hypothetical protein